jgi:hypothetical protein
MTFSIPAQNEKYWYIGEINWDPNVLKIYRNFCYQNSYNKRKGISILIHEVAEKELNELRYILNHFENTVASTKSLKRCGGSQREILNIDLYDKLRIEQALKDLRFMIKLSYQKPSSFYQSLILKYMGDNNE